MPFNGFLYKNQDFSRDFPTLSRDFLRLTFPGVIQYRSEIQTAKHTTRCPTLKDLGAGRLYWAVSLVWVVAVTLSVYVWFTEPADRAAALIFGSIFAFFLLAMVLYPLLRIREPDTVCVSRTTYNSREINGIYIPTSKVALSIYTFG